MAVMVGLGAGRIVDRHLVDPAVLVRRPSCFNGGEIVVMEAEVAQRQNVPAEVCGGRVSVICGGVPLDGVGDAPLLAAEMGVPGGDGSGTGGDEAAVGGEVGLVDSLDRQKPCRFGLLQLENLNVGGAVLEVHDGPDGFWTVDVAGLEDRDEIFHVGDLGVAVIGADVSVVTSRSGGVFLSGNSGDALKCRGVSNCVAAGVEDLAEDLVADGGAGADELGVLEGLHAALVDDVIGGNVLLLIRRCLWKRRLGERGVGGRHNFLLRGGEADE